MRASPLLLVLALAACRPAGGDTTGATATATTSSTGASSTTGPVDACERSDDCDTEGTEGMICVADYVAADTLGGERGPAVCAGPGECVGELDLGRWCFDHPGCCEGLRCRAVDGICERPGLGQDTDTDGGTDSDTSGTSGASTTTDTSTSGGDTDSDSDTGTSTGATTTSSTGG